MGCRRGAGRHADVPRDRFEQSGLFRVERGRARLCTAPARHALSKIDVFALFDDTGSFEPIIPTLGNLFLQLVGEVEAALPGVDFGFGVGRFEDYGGPGFGFGGESMNGRPFLLDQPIVTSADAGGDDGSTKRPTGKSSSSSTSWSSRKPTTEASWRSSCSRTLDYTSVIALYNWDRPVPI